MKELGTKNGAYKEFICDEFSRLINDETFNLLSKDTLGKLSDTAYVFSDLIPGEDPRVALEILNRIVAKKPLTAITEEEMWVEGSELSPNKNGSLRVYTCMRYPSLLKIIDKEFDKDGKAKIRYTDSRRLKMINIDDIEAKDFYIPIVARIFDDMIPITLPYFPADDPYKVYVEAFPYYPHHVESEVFDTLAIWTMMSPTKKNHNIRKFLCRNDETSIWEEISQEEYSKRREVYEERRDKEVTELNNDQNNNRETSI